MPRQTKIAKTLLIEIIIMIPTILKICLSALLFYSSFVSIYINFVNKQVDFYSLFFSISLCSLCFLLCYHVYQTIKEELQKNHDKTKAILLLSLCLASLSIGFFNTRSIYEKRAISNDETSQFGRNSNTIKNSQAEQQPPLDYYFSAFSEKLFHTTSKFSIRFHAMLFYFILCCILPLGLYYYSSLLISVLGSLLFLNNNLITLNSVNARPLNLALLTGFLFLFFYLSFYQSKKKQSLIPVICSQYLFVLSIGLQPVIFIMTLFCSSFHLFFHSEKDILKKLFVSHIITGILAAPFYFNMLIFGKSTEKFKEISLSSILHYFSKLDLFNFIQKYFLSFYSKMSLSFLSLLLGWILLTVLTKQKLNKKTLLLLSSAFIFPWFFDAIFLIGIYYTMADHYFIVFSLILIFLFIFIFQDLNNYLKHNKFYFYILIPFLILFSRGIYLQTLKTNYLTSGFKYHSGHSVEEVYDYLKEKGVPEDFVLEIRLMPILGPNFSYIKNHKMLFYDLKKHPTFINKTKKYTTKPPFFYENNSFTIYYINFLESKVSYNKTQKVFFITRKDKISVERRENLSYQVLSQLLPEKLIGNFAIFTLTLSSKNKEKEYIHFLLQAKDKTPKKHQSSLLETLIYYAYQEKRKTEFKKLLQEYKEITNHQPKYVKTFKYPARFDHLRRIKYFENLNWD